MYDVGIKRVVLTGRKVSYPAMANLDQVLNTAANGGVTSIIITPPEGQIWRVKLLHAIVPIPAGATTGTHMLSLRSGSGSGYGEVLRAVSTNTSTIVIQFNTVTTANAPSGAKIPISEEAQQAAILNIAISNEVPLYVLYSNNTDVVQTGTITLRMLKEVEYIV